MGSLAQKSSGAIRCSCNPRFRRRFRKVLLQKADEVPDGSGADSKVPKVPVQIADKVLEGSGAESWWGSGGFWCRKLMRFRRVAGQIADEVPEGSGTHSKQSSGGFRYKNIPRSSKLLGITHGFIYLYLWWCLWGLCLIRPAFLLEQLAFNAVNIWLRCKNGVLPGWIWLEETIDGCSFSLFDGCWLMLAADQGLMPPATGNFMYCWYIGLIGASRLSYSSFHWMPGIYPPLHVPLLRSAFPSSMWFRVEFRSFVFLVFSPTARLAMGSLAQKSSGAIRCSCNPRFRRRFRKVPEGSVAESWWGSSGFGCRKLMKFRRVLVQKADEVPVSSGAESWWGSGEGSGAESWWGSRGSGADSKVPKVPVQVADKVLEGSGAESWWGSGGFWCRKLMRFRRVAGQIADEVLEGSGTHSKQSSPGFRYKNIPRSSKLLGITHGFIGVFFCATAFRSQPGQQMHRDPWK